MRKIIMSNLVTLDGFFAGPNGEIDWYSVDEEFKEYSIGLLHSVDALLFGRKTYQLMESYWPTSMAATDDPMVAEKMNNLPKIVVSTTLDEVNWTNSNLIKENIVEQLSQLKKQSGKNMVILGSGELTSLLTKFGLIDEYRIFVYPVVLGSGKPLFKDFDEKLKLKLLTTKMFGSGVTLLTYQLDK